MDKYEYTPLSAVRLAATISLELSESDISTLARGYYPIKVTTQMVIRCESDIRLYSNTLDILTSMAKEASKPVKPKNP